MKYILISLIVFCSVVSRAQIYFDTAKLTVWSHVFEVDRSNKIVLAERVETIDTVKVIMLVCDTSFSTVSRGIIGASGFEDYKIYNNSLSWRYGYYIEDRGSIFISYYLDADKNKLPKNIIVWMAQGIK